MVTIIGGSYQGKLEYAMSTYDVYEKDIFIASEVTLELDFSKKIIYKLELFILSLIRNNIDPTKYFENALPSLMDKIIICDDITCSVVPMSAEERKWREAVGRSLTLLGKNSNIVTRVFCGIATNIKEI